MLEPIERKNDHSKANSVPTEPLIPCSSSSLVLELGSFCSEYVRPDGNDIFSKLAIKGGLAEYNTCRTIAMEEDRFIHRIESIALCVYRLQGVIGLISNLASDLGPFRNDVDIRQVAIRAFGSRRQASDIVKLLDSTGNYLLTRYQSVLVHLWSNPIYQQHFDLSMRVGCTRVQWNNRYTKFQEGVNIAHQDLRRLVEDWRE